MPCTAQRQHHARQMGQEQFPTPDGQMAGVGNPLSQSLFKLTQGHMAHPRLFLVLMGLSPFCPPWNSL